MGDSHWQLEGSAAELYERYLVPGITAEWAEDLVDRAQFAQLERLLRDAGFDDIAALTVEQTIAFPSVLDYVRFQLLAKIHGSYEPVVVEDPPAPCDR